MSAFLSRFFCFLLFPAGSGFGVASVAHVTSDSAPADLPAARGGPLRHLNSLFPLFSRCSPRGQGLAPLPART